MLHLSDIVEECPELEELTIHYIPWEYEEYFKVLDQPIHLPRLRLARIKIDDYRCAQELLCRIVVPSDARVWIGVDQSETEQSMVDTLVQASASFFRQLQGPLVGLGMAMTTFDAGVYGCIKGSTGALVLVIEHVDGFPAHVKLSTFDPLLDMDLSHLLRFECSIEETKEPRPCSSPEWWRQMFIRAPDLTSLAFRREDIAIAAIHALMSAEESDGASATSPAILPPLPDLQSIAISGQLRPNLLTRIQDERRTLYQVQRLLSTRNGRIDCAKKLKAWWFSQTDKPKNFKELLDVNLVYIRDPLQCPRFLLDPRYWWDWNLDPEETEDSLLD